MYVPVVTTWCNYAAEDIIGEFGELIAIWQWFMYLPVFSLPLLYSIGA